VLKKTSTGPSTDATVLQELADNGHLLPALLMEYRELAKLENTYLDALPELVNPVTGRLHTSFNQTVASSGRLSSSDPNLQNIPIRRELGRDIRRGFIPRAGWTLLAADYSRSSFGYSLTYRETLRLSKRSGPAAIFTSKLPQSFSTFQSMTLHPRCDRERRR
jgi:hypothetical protein